MQAPESRMGLFVIPPNSQEPFVPEFAAVRDGQLVSQVVGKQRRSTAWRQHLCLLDGLFLYLLFHSVTQDFQQFLMLQFVSLEFLSMSLKVF
jgi:hypothetical protein